MAYKMRGHLLPGINQRSEGNTDLPDGRSGSSPLQKSSPAKCPLLAMAPAIIGAVGAMKKAKDSPAKQTKHTGKFGTTANLSKDGKKFTEFVSDPKSKSQSSTMTEFDLMTPKELAKAKINPKKTGVYTSKTGDKRTLS